jgi:origin recognition complex subunit 6
MVRDVLVRAKEDERVSGRVGDEEGDWDGWEEVVEKDVNMWRKEIVVKGWREMDWFENIVEGCGVDGEGHSDTGDDDDDDDSTSVEEGEARRATAGSMINPKYIVTLAGRRVNTKSGET